jgi:hypothetical protein
MLEAGTHKENTAYGTPTYDMREIFQSYFSINTIKVFGMDLSGFREDL